MPPVVEDRGPSLPCSPTSLSAPGRSARCRLGPRSKPERPSHSAPSSEGNNLASEARCAGSPSQNLLPIKQTEGSWRARIRAWILRARPSPRRTESPPHAPGKAVRHREGKRFGHAGCNTTHAPGPASPLRPTSRDDPASRQKESHQKKALPEPFHFVLCRTQQTRDVPACAPVYAAVEPSPFQPQCSHRHEVLGVPWSNDSVALGRSR